MDENQKLYDIKNDLTRTDLERAVAKIIINATNAKDKGYSIKGYIKDLMNHGCISGMVGELIYYRDTYRFFDRYSDDIFALIDEIEEEQGHPIKVDSDRKNFYSWLAFEETARKIANEIGIET